MPRCSNKPKAKDVPKRYIFCIYSFYECLDLAVEFYEQLVHNKYSRNKKGVFMMPNIKPISDLRNYNEVLRDIAVGAPVFLTKNGRGRYAIVDMEEYEKT